MNEFTNGKRIIMDDEDAFRADQPEPSSSFMERDGEDFINEFAAQWGLNQETAIGILQQADQRAACLRTNGAIARAVMCRELEHRQGVFTTVIAYDGNKHFALECAAYAHGWGPILLVDKDGKPVKTMQQLADKWKCEKENVRKLVHEIQTDNDLPPVPGQREEEGCKNMSDARKAQLKDGNN